MIIRELGRIKQIVEEVCGLDVSHFYDDIVFVEHSPFLIRFDDKDSRHFHVYFNRECTSENREKLFQKLVNGAQTNEMKCSDSGSFSLEQLEGSEEIKINFYEPEKI